jgi:L-ribulose-5-phosphate 4-epimerase
VSWVTRKISNFGRDLRTDVLEGARAIFQKGLVETGEGNVSIRVPGRDELLITPAFNRYGAMNEDDVVHLSFDGKQLTGGKPASTEYRLHVVIYKARPRAQCVIHTHSPYATMLSVVRKKIPVLMEEMIAFLGGEIDVSEFAPAHTEELGDKVVMALRTNNAALLASHGTVVCARNMEYAVKSAELVEKMAMIYWGASLIGEATVIPEGPTSGFRDYFDSNYSTYT